IVSIRKLSTNKAISIKEILAHFDFILDNNLRLVSSQKINSTSSAVNLLTVHKAKGLEFHTVFLINCQQDEWIKTNSDGRNSISLPKNLPIDKNDETLDDKLRLFYVAASRAKTNLFLSYHEINEDKNKNAQIMEFLTDYLQEEKEESTSIKTLNFEETLKNEKTINLYNFKNNDEKAILKDTLQKFKLSITHLNNFIDLINSGPIDFLENSLLKFPQKISTSNAYGSAVHNALNVLQRKFQKETILPSTEFLLEEFKKQLLKQRLNKDDFVKCLNKGNDHLKMYFETQKNNFNKTDKAEVKFNNQGVIINNVPLNGNIDKMKFDFETNKVIVVEYKTGNALNSFDGGNDSQKIKSLKYRNQLVFYKLLVENSKFYKMYKVDKGIVEFIDPKNENIKILEHDISTAETDTMKKLISAIYNKIINLDFPDTSKYKKSFKGSEDFINDLLSKKI
ncbi:MAG: 3'-5' exonuclease, partial [Candidatus Gracilibacteria bacterium]